MGKAFVIIASESVERKDFVAVSYKMNESNNQSSVCRLLEVPFDIFRFF